MLRFGKWPLFVDAKVRRRLWMLPHMGLLNKQDISLMVCRRSNIIYRHLNTYNGCSNTSGKIIEDILQKAAKVLLSLKVTSGFY